MHAHKSMNATNPTSVYRRIRSMSLESWKVFFEVGGIVLLALTFIFGAGAWLANNRLSAIQTKELDDFKLKFQEEQQKTAEAQAEAARAQLQLRQYIENVEKKAGPRRLNREKFLEMLNGKPTGTAIVLYKSEDTEAFQFAGQICANLKTAGWNVVGPTVLPAIGRGSHPSSVPTAVIQGGAFGTGVTLKCKNPHAEIGETSAIGALADALTCGREGPGDLEVTENSTLSENVFQIVIGQKK